MSTRLPTLSLDTCRVIIDSLRHGQDRVRDYSYQDEGQRRASMEPIEQALDEVRSYRDELKALMKSAARRRQRLVAVMEKSER